jgi:hypothetical protein
MWRHRGGCVAGVTTRCCETVAVGARHVGLAEWMLLSVWLLGYIT